MVPRVGLPINTFGGAVDLLVVRVCIHHPGLRGHHAFAVDNVAKGIVDRRDLLRRATGDNIFDMIVTLVNPPLGEIGDHFAAATAGG